MEDIINYVKDIFKYRLYMYCRVKGLDNLLGLVPQPGAQLVQGLMDNDGWAKIKTS